jgi:hypothetical protein
MSRRNIRKILVLLIITTIVASGVVINGFAAASNVRISLSKNGNGISEPSVLSSKGDVIHIKAPGKATWNAEEGVGENVNEGRITIELPEGTKLGDLDSLSWSTLTVSGYPAHADFLLDMDNDGVFDGGKKNIVTGETSTGVDDVLVFEFAYQPYIGSNYSYMSPGDPYGHYDPDNQSTFYDPTYGVWLKTFQKNSTESNTIEINNSTVAWLYSGLPGPYEGGYFGTLSDYKDGNVTIIGGTQNSEVHNDTIVLEIQIEVDNWLGGSEAYIDDVNLNSELIMDAGPPSVEIIKPKTQVYSVGNVPLEIEASDAFGIKNMTYNLWKTSEGYIYETNKMYSGPSVLSSLAAGGYILHVWVENNLNLTTEATRSFSVGTTGLSVEIHPETLNLKSNGRWVTVMITLPTGVSADEINMDDIRLWADDNSIKPDWGSAGNGNIMVKFDRTSLKNLIDEEGNVSIRITGKLPSGQAFEGEATLRVINPGNGHHVTVSDQKSNSNELKQNRGNSAGKGKGKN